MQGLLQRELSGKHRLQEDEERKTDMWQEELCAEPLQ